MLDAFIIDELKRRERIEQDENRPRPALEIPLDEESLPPGHDDEEEDADRGVIIIDLGAAIRLADARGC